MPLIRTTGPAQPPLERGELGLDDGLRIADYARWRAFAGGQQWEGRQPRGQRRLVANYARALVRKVASYVFADPVQFEVKGDPAAEQALAALSRALALPALDFQLEIERSTIGDAAVKVTWDAATAQPRVVSVDPATLTALWSPADPHHPLQVTQTYELPGHALTAFLPPASQLNAEQLYPVTETWSPAEWRMTIAGAVVRAEANPYGWIPYLVLPNEPGPRRFWGFSDLVDLVDVARELNRELTILGRIMELSGAPIAVLENVDGSEGIAVGPGAKWELPENSKAYLLDLLAGQGVRLHVDYIDQLRTTLHDLSETPRTAFGDTGRTLSGAALEVEIQPLVQRVKRKRTTWDRFYMERNRRLLDLLARFAGQAFPTTTTETLWPEILPSDEDASVRNNVQLVAAGIRSRRTAASLLGAADPDAELAQVEKELSHARSTAQETRAGDPGRPPQHVGRQRGGSGPDAHDGPGLPAVRPEPGP